MNAVINDNLISNSLCLITLSIAVCMAILGYLISLFSGEAIASSLNVKDQATVTIYLVVLGAIIGGIVGSLLITMLESAVAMVYVCFAEDPDALRVSVTSSYYLFFQISY